MSESNVKKGDLADFARQTEAFIQAAFRRQQDKVNLLFDVLVSVLGCEEKVRAELDRRTADAKFAELFKKEREKGKTEQEAESTVATVRAEWPCKHAEHIGFKLCPDTAVANAGTPSDAG